MDFKLNRWIRNQKFKALLAGDKVKEKANYLKSSIIAISIGLIIGAIVVYINGYDGLGFLVSCFDYAISESTINKTMNYFAVYMFMGLGLALGFKVGIFNMGGSGQAILGLTLASLAIGLKAKHDNISFSEVNSSFMFTAFLLFIFSGVIVSLTAGLLKVLFNIHEVVTTVMLNWVVWYFSKWILSADFTKSIVPQDIIGTTPSLNSSWLNIGDNNWALGVILAFLSILVMYLLITFTTFGFKFRVVGKQPEAAHYAGIKNKQYIILTTALQGLFIGLGAMFYWMNIKRNENIVNELLPSIGFDAIPITLVAFNNLIGIIPVALIWASLQTGSEQAIGIEFMGLSEQVPQLIFGIIIYVSAIYILFLKMKPIELLKEFIYQLKDITLKQIVTSYRSKIAELNVSKKTVKLLCNLSILKLHSSKTKESDLIRNLQEVVDLFTSYNLKKEDQSFLIRNKFNSIKESIKKIKSYKDMDGEKPLDQDHTTLNALKKIEENYFDFANAQIKRVQDEIKAVRHERYQEFLKDSYKSIAMDFKKMRNLNWYLLMDELIIEKNNSIEIIKNLKATNSPNDFLRLKNDIQEELNLKSQNKILTFKQQVKEMKSECLEKQIRAKVFLKELWYERNNQIKMLKNDRRSAIKSIKDGINILEDSKVISIKESKILASNKNNVMIEPEKNLLMVKYNNTYKKSLEEIKAIAFDKEREVNKTHDF